MRHILPLILALLMVLSLAACKSGGEEQILESTAPPPTPTESKPTIILPPKAEPPETKPENIRIVITVAGDCMLASYKGYGDFNQKAKDGDWEYFLAGAAKYFRDDDFTLVNLENTLTDNNLEPIEKPEDPAFWFKGPTQHTNILTSQSVEIVSLANNHCGDYGYQGLLDTQKACTEAGLLWGYEDKTVYVEKEGFRIAFICCGLWSDYQTSGIIKRVQQAKENSDFQIVYFHGGTESIHTPEAWKIQASRAIVDAGAGLVIGNHPHVLQPYERYNGTPIIYSIGNFCFGGGMDPENRTILYRFTIELDSETKKMVGTSDEIIPFYVYDSESRYNNFQPVEIEDPEIRATVLEFMYHWTESPL